MKRKNENEDIVRNDALYLHHLEKSEHLTHIYLLMKDKKFGYRMSAEIVGGRARLDKLIGLGRVKAEKKSSAQNGKIYCNARDVLLNAKYRFK